MTVAEVSVVAQAFHDGVAARDADALAGLTTRTRGSFRRAWSRPRATTPSAPRGAAARAAAVRFNVDGREQRLRVPGADDEVLSLRSPSR
jgi:hypothetical protein